MAQKIKCPSCGKFNKSGSSFCIFCSYQIGEITEDETPINEEDNMESASTETEEEKVIEDTPTSSPAPAREKSSNYSDENNNYKEETGSEEDDEDDNEEITEEDEESDEPDTDNEYESTDDEQIYEEDDDEDDDDAFNDFIGNKKSDDTVEEKPNNSSMLKKINKVSTQKAVMSTISKIINVSKSATPVLTNHQSKATTEKKNISYDPNSDGYYDNLLALVDAKIDHIPKENVVKTIAIIIAFIIFVFSMIYLV